ncbi:MAG: hypothetical protein ACK5L0_05310 [Candidatus Fimivivens sp.]
MIDYYSYQIRKFINNVMTILICLLLLGWVYNFQKTNEQKREAKKEYLNVEVINKISDTRSFLLIQDTDYILVVKVSEGCLVSVSVDAAAYAVIERGDTISMAFYRADNANTYEPFNGTTKLIDLDLTAVE